MMKRFKPNYFNPRISRDVYGGYPGLTFDATGYFYLAKKRSRWWFVDPLGNAFLSFGINHIETRRILQPANREYWANQFGIANTEDPEAFYPGIRKKVRTDLKRLGLNTLGCHTDHSWYDESFIPYVKPVRFVDICHYMTPGKEMFHDVFSEDYIAHCRKIVEREVAPHAQDPFLLGYNMTDCPVFTELDAGPRINNIYGTPRPGLPTWPNVLRNLGGGEAGKRAYVICMRDLYSNNIDSFNTVYCTAFASFEELQEKANWRPGMDNQNEKEISDNLEFLYKIVDRAYQVQTEAIRKCDTNHLIFGDKLNGNSDTPDEIVKLASKHMDLIFYQYYAFWENQHALVERWSKLTDKPFFMGDSAVSVPTRNIPDPYGPHCGTQELRAERTLEIFNNAFARKDFVGWNWCGWMDQWHVGETPQWKQHSGLQTPFGEFHQPMVEVFSQFSVLMYEKIIKNL